MIGSEPQLLVRPSSREDRSPPVGIRLRFRTCTPALSERPSMKLGQDGVREVRHDVLHCRANGMVSGCSHAGWRKVLLKTSPEGDDCVSTKVASRKRDNLPKIHDV